MENLNVDIKRKILNYLADKTFGASSSEISKNIGHNRITVSKYLEIMRAHKLLRCEDIAQAKMWQLSTKSKQKRILCVDDEPHIIELIKLTLQGDSYSIIEAYSGLDALDKVRSEAPDLIILDLMMPGISGYEVCHRIKADAITQHIPVMILSAKSDLKDKMKGINLGAEDYLTKPFDPDELTARVKSILTGADEKDKNNITGLPGKASLLKELSSRHEKTKIYRLRIVGLKNFSKKMGFKKGNSLLNLTAKILSERTRADEGSSCFHMANDDFIILSNRDDIEDEIRSSIKRIMPYICAGSKSRCKTSLSFSKIAGFSKEKDAEKIVKKIEG